MLFSELGGFGSAAAGFTVVFESCDLLVDLPLESIVAGVIGLLEAAVAAIFAAVVFFVVTAVLFKVGDCKNNVALSRVALFVRGVESSVVVSFSVRVDCEVVGAFSVVFASPAVSLGGSFVFKTPSFISLSRVKQN